MPPCFDALISSATSFARRRHAPPARGRRSRRRPTRSSPPAPMTGTSRPAYDKSKSDPLIVLVHGYGANGFVQDALFGLAAARRRSPASSSPIPTARSTDRRALLERHRCLLRLLRLGRRRRRLRQRRSSTTWRPSSTSTPSASSSSVTRTAASCRIAWPATRRGAWRRSWRSPATTGRTRPSATRRSRWRCCRCTATPTPSCPMTAMGLMPSAMQSVGSWAVKNGCTGDLTDTGVTYDIDLDLAGNETTAAAYTCTRRRRRALDDPRWPARAGALVARLGESCIRLVDATSEVVTGGGR